MLELIKAGGWVMLPLIVLAVFATAIILERFWTLRRREVLPPGLGDEVREWARGRSLDPRHIDVLRRYSPLGEILAAGLDVRHRPRGRVTGYVIDMEKQAIGLMDALDEGPVAAGSAPAPKPARVVKRSAG